MIRTDDLLHLYDYWARLESKIGEDILAARGVWENLLKKSGSLLEAWQGYVQMEIGLGHINEARSIYKRCYTKRLSGAGSEEICHSWLRFEREYGTLEDYDLAVKKLRNLVWATSKHDIFLLSHYSIIHWSVLTGEKSEVLDVSGHVAPSEKHPGNLNEGFSQTQVSTMAVKDNLLVAGGFQGEIICKYLDRPGVSFCCRTTYDDNAITNAVEIYNSPSGAVRFMASNNDCGVRDYDVEKFQISKHFQYPWPVNHSSLSPDGKLLVIVGDNPEGILADAQSGKNIQELSGHFDFSFASAWHPNGLTFATGNQDKTCRVWDIRNLSKSLAVLKSHLGAVRSIRFSSDGRFMATAEPADFVHVYDVNTGYQHEQELDFFGEISGLSFSPDSEAVFVGVSDRNYGSLLQFNRRRNSGSENHQNSVVASPLPSCE